MNKELDGRFAHNIVTRETTLAQLRDVITMLGATFVTWTVCNGAHKVEVGVQVESFDGVSETMVAVGVHEDFVSALGLAIESAISKRMS